ncbi:MAG: hypothetical protein HC812_16770 [Leptolyngbya sp. RL_3_1]|nr:hypothetical protein [Leptolyngbya sp. RL_3_1]
MHHQGQTLLSPHLGDLDTVPGRDRFQEMIHHLCGLYDLQLDQVDAIACDAHPDYASTQFAQTLTASPTGPQLIIVQHHYAHVLAGMADNQWQPPVLGIAWDGTGYGLDGTTWGGEVLWIPRAGAPPSRLQAVGSYQALSVAGGRSRRQRAAPLGHGAALRLLG